MSSAQNVARLHDVTHRYGKTTAVESFALELPAGRLIGFIGPDRVGKSTVLALISGVRKIQSGRVEVLGENISKVRTRAALCARIAYMPQGLGKNLYPTLSVQENIDFFWDDCSGSRRTSARRASRSCLPAQPCRRFVTGRRASSPAG
jgi:ribosome-dependent ATPase